MSGPARGAEPSGPPDDRAAARAVRAQAVQAMFNSIAPRTIC